MFKFFITLSISPDENNNIGHVYTTLIKCGSRRGGTGGLDPPGKSQVIWVSIGNKQLDPLEKVGPPPPPGKCWTPLEPRMLIEEHILTQRAAKITFSNSYSYRYACIVFIALMQWKVTIQFKENWYLILPLNRRIVVSSGAPYKIEHLIDVTTINVNCTPWRGFDVSSKLFTLK